MTTLRNKLALLPLIAGLLLGSTGIALAHEHHAATAYPAAFESVKGLAGTWTGASAMGPCTIAFKVTAGGSAVVETMFPGSEHEMLNVYHPDGDTVRMTHYCAGGNQPQMQLSKAEKPNDVRFVAKTATNLPTPTAGFMNECVLHIVDKDHLESVWISSDTSKGPAKMVFTLTRSK